MNDQPTLFAVPEPKAKPAKPASATCEWYTPPGIFDQLNEEFRFTVDVAATAKNTKCERFYTKEQDGSRQEWRGERVWCNPPYDKKSLEAFAYKALAETRADPDTLAVLLVPVKSDQQWWHDVALHAEVRWIRGRVAFGGYGCTAPMPVCVLVLSQHHAPKMVSMAQRQLGLEGT